MTSSSVDTAPWDFPVLRRDTFAAISFALASAQRFQHKTGANGTSHEHLSDDHASSNDDTIHPRDLSKAKGKAKLQRKFLNRLAEIMARQKTCPRGSGPTTPGQTSACRSDADHVSAAMLAFRNEIPIVLVAKNTGLTDEKEDTYMLGRLCKFLRLVCISGQRRHSDKDIMLSELVKYNNKRIEYYLESLQTERNLRTGSEPDFVVKIFEKCAKFSAESKESHKDLLNIISLAFEARYKKMAGVHAKIARTIACMGRIQAAWTTLIEFALHDAGCEHIEIHAVDEDTSLVPKNISRQTLSRAFEAKSGSWSRRSSVAARKKLNSTKTSPWPLFTHAEMQLLAYYGSKEQDNRKLDFLPYIGSSKKTCWLCEQTLMYHGFFESRGSHGEVSAHWTFNGLQDPSLGFQSQITHALCKVQSDMEAMLTSEKVSKGVPIAQSTAGITTTGSAATLARHKHKHYLRQKYASRRVKSEQVPEPAPRPFGEPRGSIRAMKLPAHGHAMELVTLNVFARAPDTENDPRDTVIDFSPFWPENPADYRDSSLEVEGNGAAQDGYYRVYYTLQPELGLNEYIRTSLGVQDPDVIAHSSFFWRGDVFIVRHDNQEPYWQHLTLLPEPIADASLSAYFQELWKTGGLERALHNEQSLQDFSERFRRDRELELASLSPLEQDILHHMPAPFEAMLDYLVIRDTHRDIKMESDPDDPVMKKIRMESRKSEEERLGWQGFSSAELPLRGDQS